MKRVLLIIAFIVSVSGASAQRFDYGLKTGMNVATLAGIEGDTPRYGFVGGGTFEWHATRVVSLQTELLFSMQGARYRDRAGVEAEYAYDYVNIPLLAKLYLFDRQVALLAGVQFGILTSPSIEYTLHSGDGLIRWRTGFEKGTYNPFEYSAAVGAEWNVGYGFGVDVRYTLGLLQIHYGRSTSVTQEDHITVPDNRNSVMQLSLFYRF